MFFDAINIYNFLKIKSYMDFKLKYNIDSNELESSVAEKYRQAITKCRESDDPFDSLESLNDALESLEDSFAASGREIESWEMIRAYRNLCRVYMVICSSEKYADYEGIIDALKEEGIENVGDLSGVLDSDPLEERVKKSIKTL